MKKVHFTLVLFLCIVSKSVYSNIQVDSLSKIWQNEKLLDSTRFNALHEYQSIYENVMPDSVLIALDYYYDLAVRKKANRQIYRALLGKGNIYRLQDKCEESIKNYKAAQVIAKKMNDSRLEAIIIGNLGNVSYQQSKYLEAIQYYNKAKSIFIAEADLEGEARMLLSIGALNAAIGNDDIALIHYNEALTLNKKINAPELSMAIISMNIGLIHINNKLYNVAEKSFNNALKLLQIKNDKFFIKDCYLTLGVIKLELNEIEAASIFANKSLELNQELDIKSGIINTQVLIAKINYLKDKNKAISEMESILTQLPKNSEFETREEIYEFLYAGYKYQKKWDLSLKMHELFLAYRDSIQERKDGFKVIRESVKNEYEAKLFEKQLENEKKEANLRLYQFKKIALIITLSLIVLLSLIYFMQSNNKKNRERRDLLLDEIKLLKRTNITSISNSNEFELSKAKIDNYLIRGLNETDWNILLVLLENPVSMNTEIAEKVFLSLDGVGSSLKRMYDYFEIEETKYKKIALLRKAIKISNSIE